MSNRLSGETSPYLRQHACNPVDWHPWGAAAFAEARATDRPVLLSIGYAACHWCHVMAHESFDDSATAAVMNDLFVNVKVDREERPDLDGIYMQAVQAMTGRGGWPLTVFLTPDGEPFYGGTYFPPKDTQGIPSFTRLMQSVANAWRTKRDAVRATTATLRELYVNASAPLTASGPVSSDALSSAAAVLQQLHDPEHHGFGGSPKFPHTMALDFLLRHGTRHASESLLNIVTESWLAMARGGICDQLGGGFARYATDREWIVPHFEKMLYDNALLARLGVHLAQSTGSEEIERVTRDTFDWVLREMTGPEGGIYASIDADSEGEEGRYYTWTRGELRDLLGARSGLAELAYGVTANGNFDGRSILLAPLPRAIVALRLGLSEPEAETELAAIRATLLAARATRVTPATDRKRIAAWNGLMLAALADGARVFADAGLLNAAQRLATFLMREMVREGRVCRTWMDGVCKAPGFLDDAAAVAVGMLALYDATGDIAHLGAARTIARRMVEEFYDAAACSFYDTAHGHEALISRARDLTDNATPSGAALACDVLLRLAALDDEPSYHDIVVKHVSALVAPMTENPLGFGHWLGVMDRLVHGAVEVALVAGDEGTTAFEAAMRQSYVPTLSLARGPAAGDAPVLLRDRLAIEGRTTAYVCRGSTCELPTSDVSTFARQLRVAVRFTAG